jgi:transcription initiation factor IIE alpha subunit
MKKIIILAIALSISSTGIFAQAKAGREDTTKHATFYSCPNHPDSVKHQPGKCSVCGMQLNLSKKEEMNAGIRKNYTCPVHLEVVSEKEGNCSKCNSPLVLSNKEKMKAKEMKYTCPMHSDVNSKKSGKCPKCGMDLTKTKKQ